MCILDVLEDLHHHHHYHHHHHTITRLVLIMKCYRAMMAGDAKGEDQSRVATIRIFHSCRFWVTYTAVQKESVQRVIVI